MYKYIYKYLHIYIAIFVFTFIYTLYIVHHAFIQFHIFFVGNGNICWFGVLIGENGTEDIEQTTILAYIPESSEHKNCCQI